MTSRAGIACIAASAAAFGAMAIFARFAYADGVDTWTLLALRFAIAAACLGALAKLAGNALPRGRDLAGAALMGGVGYAGQAATFFTALGLAPAGIVALLLYLHPALVAVLAALFLHERMTRTKVIALLLALAGLALTVLPALSGSASEFPRLPLGIAFGVAAAVVYAVYIVAGTRLTTRVAPLALSAVIAASAALVFVGVATLRGPQWPATGAGWAAVVAIAIVSTVLAISLFFAGLARVGATRAATLSTIEPVVTIALAALVLGERIAAVQLAGGALILGAVLLLARSPR
ncbi:MAG: DMT family transporter [Betaproteobacteria bacterium]|nr:DMT family transporter [Betaproteobacteria bacterium]